MTNDCSEEFVLQCFLKRASDSPSGPGPPSSLDLPGCTAPRLSEAPRRPRRLTSSLGCFTLAADRRTRVSHCGAAAPRVSAAHLPRQVTSSSLPSSSSRSSSSAPGGKVWASATPTSQRRHAQMKAQTSFMASSICFSSS